MTFDIIQAPMTPREALSLLSTTKDWPSFLAAASKVQLAEEHLQCLGDQQILHDLDESFIDAM